MKRIVILCLLLAATTAVMAQATNEWNISANTTDINTNGTEAADSASGNNASIKEEILASSRFNNRITFFGGYHAHLYGYTGQRYLGDDKSNYISTDSEQAGFEIVTNYLIPDKKNVKDMRYGMNFNFYRRGDLGERNLYAVPSHNILAETVPPQSYNKESNMRYNIGFFLGYHKKWFAADFGLTVLLDYEEQEKRERLLPDGTTTWEEGRGYSLDDASILPNFFIRVGTEDTPHLTLDIMRSDYDIRYGMIQMKLIFPIVSFFSFKVGGYLFKREAVFIEPTFTFKTISIAAKVGTVLNYNDTIINRVGLKDSMIYSGSVSYQW